MKFILQGNPPRNPEGSTDKPRAENHRVCCLFVQGVFYHASPVAVKKVDEHFFATAGNCPNFFLFLT
jgi:hypothetical protein